MIKIVAEEVPKLNPAHSVDLKNPDRTIMMELYRVGSSTMLLLTRPEPHGHERCAGL